MIWTQTRVHFHLTFQPAMSGVRPANANRYRFLEFLIRALIGRGGQLPPSSRARTRSIVAPRMFRPSLFLLARTKPGSAECIGVSLPANNSEGGQSQTLRATPPSKSGLGCCDENLSRA
jgi:hypothetical protein